MDVAMALASGKWGPLIGCAIIWRNSAGAFSEETFSAMVRSWLNSLPLEARLAPSLTSFHHCEKMDLSQRAFFKKGEHYLGFK